MFKRLVDRFFTPKTKPATSNDTVLSGAEGAFELLEMYEKHGPLDMLIEADPSQKSWPFGVVLVGVKITDTITMDDYETLTVDIAWDEERAIRTGLARRIFGP